MNNFKLITLSLVAATALSFTGCGGGGSSTPSSSTGSTGSTGSTTTPTVTDNTAYDYFVKDAGKSGDDFDATGGTIYYNDKTTVAGVDESTIWKGTAGSMDPIETPNSTANTVDLTVGKAIVDVPATPITKDTTWTKNNVYVLEGHVKVQNAKLTIEPGTVVAGKIPNSYLLIDTTATIDANGTKAEPITFTSLKDANGTSTQNATGEWGGFIIAGLAHTHYSGNTYEADTSVSFGSTGHDHDADSSGILNYVSIKHSGYAVEIDKELNGLSLAGVGSGTTLTNIAVIGGADDGMEIWGGMPNLTNLYIYNAQDDSTDTDLGYRGTLKNVLVRQNVVDNTNSHDSSCMEFGNDENTITTDDSTATQPNVINYTCYVKGGGFYNKNDAGFKWNNVKFISDKTAAYELAHFRSADAYTTGAKHLLGDVSFYDSNVVLTQENTYSKKNSKVQ